MYLRVYIPPSTLHRLHLRVLEQCMKERCSARLGRSDEESIRQTLHMRWIDPYAARRSFTTRSYFCHRNCSGYRLWSIMILIRSTVRLTVTPCSLKNVRMNNSRPAQPSAHVVTQPSLPFFPFLEPLQLCIVLPPCPRPRYTIKYTMPLQRASQQLHIDS